MTLLPGWHKRSNGPWVRVGFGVTATVHRTSSGWFWSDGHRSGMAPTLLGKGGAIEMADTPTRRVE